MPLALRNAVSLVSQSGFQPYTNTFTYPWFTGEDPPGSRDAVPKPVRAELAPCENLSERV